MVARGFGTGVLWGVIVAGAGLVLMSQLAPPVTDQTAVPAADASLATDGATTATGQDQVAAKKLAAEMAADMAAAQSAAADKAAADSAAAEKAAADSAAAEKAAAVKAAAEKAAAVKAAADKAAAVKAAADSAAADKAAADKAAAVKAAADSAAAEKAAAVKTAAEQAAAENAAAERAADQAAADKVVVDTAERHKVATEQPLTAAAPDPNPPEALTDAPAGLAGAAALPLPQAPAGPDPAPSLTGLDQALTMPAEEPAPAAAEPVPAQPEGPKDTLLVPGQPEGQPEPARLPQIAPVTDPDVAALPPEAAPEPRTDAAPATSPASTLRDDQPTLPAVKPLQDKLPTTVLDKTVPGVTVDKLPQVGAAALPEVAAEASPVKRFARDFVATGKPLFVILLHDVGAAGVARAELARLPFPVSFVVDPLATDARQASDAYRAAGQEVLTLANGIPQGATAADLETTFGTLTRVLPESVAVIDQDVGGFQDQRPLATLVLPVIKGEGRGVVTYDRGLNAADQIARREGVPAAVIFRRLDGEGENKTTIRRYLDRAAFKAAQEGAVVVIGDTRAETVAAILEWTLEGRAATVTLAPVTAVLGR